MATVSEDCKYLQTTIEFSIATEAFSCSGKTLISPGSLSLSDSHSLTHSLSHSLSHTHTHTH